MQCCTGRQKERKRRQELAQKTTRLLDGSIVFVCSTCDGTACGDEGVKRRGASVASLAAGCHGLFTTTSTNIQADARVSSAAFQNSINRSLGWRNLKRGVGRKSVHSCTRRILHKGLTGRYYDAGCAGASARSDCCGVSLVPFEGADPEGGGAAADRAAAACSRWSSAFRASARLLSASARVAPPAPPLLLGFIMLGRPPSARALAWSLPASISCAEKGVHTPSDTMTL